MPHTRRRYYRCRHCRTTQTPWDEWAGLEADHLTPHVRRVVVLSGTSLSFDVASARLWELCGIRVSADLVRRVTNTAEQRADRGACKTIAGRRLKHGGARWLVPRVENVGAPRCLLYSDEWKAF